MTPGSPEPSLLDMLRVPYLISEACISNLNKEGPEATEKFLEKHVNFIEHAWHVSGNASLVLFAASSLGTAVEGRIGPCLALARLYVVEAEALVAAARPEMILRARARAESAQEILLGLHPQAYSFELLSESMLIAAVTFKALGEFDNTIEYLRNKASDHRLNEVQAVALTRQEVMMFQDEDRHILLLSNAREYQISRPREYFRTLKRTVELLLNNGRLALADALAPEMGRAFVFASHDLSVLGRISFLRDLAQLYAARGDRYRALRLLSACLKIAERSSYEGQIRQLQMFSSALTSDKAGTPRLETFRVVK